MFRKIARKIKKIFFHLTIDSFYKKNIIMPLPTYIQLEPTIRCNYRCIGCTRLSAIENRKLDITIDEVKKILQLLPTLKKIKLMGLGEPFLHPNYEEILNLFKSKKIKIWSISNGSLLFREKHRNLVHKYYDDITVSIDTTDPEEFSLIRPGGPGLDRILNNIKILIEERDKGLSNISVGIAFAVGHMNYKRIDKFYDLALKLKVDYLHITAIENWTIKGQKNFEHFHDFTLESRKLQKKIDKEVRKLTLKLLSHGIITGYKNGKSRLGNCHWPFNSMFISVEGISAPCCVRMDPKFHSLGSILKLNDFNELWNGNEYIELREAHLKMNKEYAMCSICPN